MRDQDYNASASVKSLFVASLVALLGMSATTQKEHSTALSRLLSSDFNGDGAADLAVGAPFESFEGTSSGTIAEAGVVSVVYGSPSGLSAKSNQQWHQDSSDILGTAQRGDRLGWSIAFGDFDGDGFGDLAAAAPFEGLEGGAGGTIPEVGAVQILYGSGNGLTAARNQQWHEDVEPVVDSAEAGDRFGWALAVGDFDNDGFGDLAVGVPFEDVGNATEAGAVRVFFGSAKGLTAARSQQWHQNVEGVLGVAQPGDRFGWSLAVGDFDGDSFHDLAVGTPFESLEGVAGVGTIPEAGAVTILFGSTNGLRAADNQQWHQNVEEILGVAESGDRYGWSLGAGDFNGDGRDDLAVGSPFEGLEGVDGGGSIDQVGVIGVLLGSSSGLTASGNQQWHQNVPGILGVAEAGDRYGWSLAVGHFDGDKFADLSTGAPFESLEGGEAAGEAGAAGVLYGSPKGLTAARNQQWHQNIPGILGVAESGDRFSGAMGKGDFDGDGIDDLAIGTPCEGLEGVTAVGMLRRAGAVGIVYGTPTGLGATDNQQWHQNVAGILGVAERGDRFGFTISANSGSLASYDCFTRRVRLEVDQLAGVASVPLNVPLGRVVWDLPAIYYVQQIAIDVAPDDTALGDPAGPCFSLAEMDALFTANRDAAVTGTGDWNVWAGMVDCDDANAFGRMFRGGANERDGFAVFVNTITNWCGVTGATPCVTGSGCQLAGLLTANQAILRTVAHELGHTFNLCHNNGDDACSDCGGTTIMNQSGRLSNAWGFGWSGESTNHLSNSPQACIIPGGDVPFGDCTQNPCTC